MNYPTAINNNKLDKTDETMVFRHWAVGNIGLTMEKRKTNEMSFRIS